MTLSSIGIRIGQVMGKVQPHPVDHCLRLLDREPFIWISMMKPTRFLADVMDVFPESRDMSVRLPRNLVHDSVGTYNPHKGVDRAPLDESIPELGANGNMVALPCHRGSSTGIRQIFWTFPLHTTSEHATAQSAPTYRQ
jgi:hypothetical protein